MFNPKGVIDATFAGDANLDGKVDGLDYALIDNAFNSQQSLFATSVALAAQIAESARSNAAVPEPTSLGMGAVLAIASGTAGQLGRNRPRRRNI